jgi:hypothetical protein
MVLDGKSEVRVAWIFLAAVFPERLQSTGDALHRMAGRFGELRCPANLAKRTIKKVYY